MTITERIAEFVVGTGFDDLPPGAVDAAKRLFLDSLAVTMVAAAIEPGSQIIAGYVEEQGAAPDCVIVGRGSRSSPQLAALANGTMAHGLDYDDISFAWLGHPSCVLVPTVLAFGTKLDVSGAAALTAYVVGWETGAAVGRSIRHRVHEAGWHSGGVTGTMAAAAANANLAGLDVDQTRVALGLAASLAAGQYKNRGTDTKPLHAGNAARNGIVAVELARRGFSATPDIFDGEENFAHTLIGDEADVSKMLVGVGTAWDILEPGPTLKLHACCAASHYCIDSLLGLVQEHDVKVEDVKRIECHVPAGVPHILAYPAPTTGLQAKFSMQYPLAAVLLDGKVGAAQFTDAAVQRPEVKPVMEKVVFVHPAGTAASTADIVAHPHSLVLELNDGTRYERTTRFNRGRAENPLSREELLVKFRDCSEAVLSDGARNRLIGVVDGLDAVPSLRELDDALTPDLVTT